MWVVLWPLTRLLLVLEFNNSVLWELSSKSNCKQIPKGGKHPGIKEIDELVAVAEEIKTKQFTAIYASEKRSLHKRLWERNLFFIVVNIDYLYAATFYNVFVESSCHILKILWYNHIYTCVLIYRFYPNFLQYYKVSLIICIQYARPEVCHIHYYSLEVEKWGWYNTTQLINHTIV